MSASAGPEPGLSADLRGAVGSFRIEAGLEAPAGRVTSVFGPSGAGKTTLLRAVAGLTRLDGRVSAFGEVWQDADGAFVPPHRRGVGFCFQEPALFSHLTVAENLAYARRRAPERPGAPATGAVVERLELAPLLDRAPAGLSGGERQRAALGRALLSNPGVLLLDEPLSGVHLGARGRILDWLRGLARDLGLVVLQVSHDLGEVIRFAHRIALISDGRITATGPAGTILAGEGIRAPRFEASVVLVARILDTADAAGLSTLDLDGQRLRVAGMGGQPGRPVRLRVRARDVALATTRPEGLSIRNVLDGVIRELRDQPGTPFIEVVVAVGGAGSRNLLLARITRAAATELELAPGRPVHVLLKSVCLEDP